MPLNSRVLHLIYTLKITINISVVITVIIINTTIDYLVSDDHVSIASRYVSYFLDVVLF